jgi:hypothetical protein
MKVRIGKGLELDVNLERFNTAVMDHVVYTGLRNILMDSHSHHTKAEDGDNYVETSRAAAERKLEAMYNGEVRSPGGGAREVDPVKVEAQRFATAQVKKHFKQIGREADAKTIRHSAAKLIETNPSIMKTAKKNVEAANAAKLDMTAIA